MFLRNRLFLIINAENLTICKFAMFCDISKKTLYQFRQQIIMTLPDIDLLKIARNPRFNKYTLWMMTNKTAASSGQIDPALFPLRSPKQSINQ